MKKVLIVAVASVIMAGCSSKPLPERAHQSICRAYGFHMAMGERSAAGQYEDELKRRIKSGQLQQAGVNQCQVEMRAGADAARECNNKDTVDNRNWCFVGARMGIEFSD